MLAVRSRIYLGRHRTFAVFQLDTNMIYRNLATAVAIACTASAYGYAPTSTNVVKPFAHGAVSDRAVVGECDSSRRRCAPAHLNAAGGTETVDFTAGTIRPQRDVVDGQMRPRPNIDWSNLRAKLELDFGIPEETLKKYDTIEKGDMLKAYAAATTSSHCNARARACMSGARGSTHLELQRRRGQRRVVYLRLAIEISAIEISRAPASGGSAAQQSTRVARTPAHTSSSTAVTRAVCVRVCAGMR